MALLLENERITGFHAFEPRNLRLLNLELRSPKASKPVGLVEIVIPDGEQARDNERTNNSGYNILYDRTNPPENLTTLDITPFA